MVTGKRVKNLSAVVEAGPHSLTSGLSKANGGDEDGMNPHQILEAALSACTILTCQMYAKRKGWELTATHAQVEITAESASGTAIKIDIRFEGVLDDEQRARLLDIAHKCPIHRLLVGGIKIDVAVTA